MWSLLGTFQSGWGGGDLQLGSVFKNYLEGKHRSEVGEFHNFGVPNILKYVNALQLKRKHNNCFLKQHDKYST